jgi:hypothetical protein
MTYSSEFKNKIIQILYYFSSTETNYHFLCADPI